MTALLEVTLAYLLQNKRGRDEKSFFKGPAFASFMEPTISLTSPDCGETNGTFSKEYIFEGGGRFPTLEWKASDDIAPKVKEWLLVSEDPDAPFSTPNCHGSVRPLAS